MWDNRATLKPTASLRVLPQEDLSTSSLTERVPRTSQAWLLRSSLTIMTRRTDKDFRTNTLRQPSQLILWIRREPKQLSLKDKPLFLKCLSLSPWHRAPRLKRSLLSPRSKSITITPRTQPKSSAPLEARPLETHLPATTPISRPRTDLPVGQPGLNLQWTASPQVLSTWPRRNQRRTCLARCTSSRTSDSSCSSQLKTRWLSINRCHSKLLAWEISFNLLNYWTKCKGHRLNRNQSKGWTLNRGRTSMKWSTLFRLKGLKFLQCLNSSSLDYSRNLSLMRTFFLKLSKWWTKEGKIGWDNTKLSWI